MKKARLASHRWAAWFFLTAFVAAFSAREAHRFGHRHDDPREHCSTRAGEKHWHDEHFEIDDCPACAFVFAIAELPVLFPFLTQKAAAIAVFGGFEKSQTARRPEPFVGLRGPPARGVFV